jgi:cell division protein FtsQ
LQDYHRDSPKRSSIGRSKRKKVRDKARKGRRVFLFFLAIPLLAAIFIFWTYEQFRHSPFFRVKAVQVEGCARVPSQEVLNSLQLDPNANILLLDLSALSARVRSNPWIQEASICRRLPHTLLVEVLERRPAGILVADNPYLISGDGVILAPLQGHDELDLPLIRLATPGRGLQVGDLVQIGPFQSGSTIWRDLSQTLNGSGAKVREICQAKDGSLSVHLGGGMPSLRLRPESAEEQLARLREVLMRVDPDLGSLEYIDLRFSGKVILKPMGRGGEGIGKG